jgi:hypothetical protein
MLSKPRFSTSSPTKKRNTAADPFFADESKKCHIQQADPTWSWLSNQ